MPRAGIEPATFRSSVINPFLRKKGALPPKNKEFEGVLDYSSNRDDFIMWLNDKNYNERYKYNIISYLDKYLLGKIIHTPADVSKIRRTSTSKKEITIALRVLLNYCEEMDLLDEDFITKLRKPLKVVRTNPDNYVPNDNKIIEAYEKINPKYKTIFKLFLFSGTRITEAVQFLKEYKRDRVIINGEVARYPLFALRENKRSYFVYFPAKTIDEIERTEITDRAISSAFRKAGLPAKYLRKWNYNFLIMYNVPESVADFIQGRSPISIGSMHYLAKVKQADYWYNKIAREIVSVLNTKDDSIEHHTLKVKTAGVN